MTHKVALLILDGWGVTSQQSVSAAASARTPFLDTLKGKLPYTELMASEEAVGLPSGQVGNSEVGHSTLGTGRVNYQNLVRIHNYCKEQNFSQHPLLIQAKQYAQDFGKTIHIIGLLSDGGVHSHIDHIKALVIAMDDTTPCSIHAILDGRDTDPQSGLGFLKDFQQFLQQSPAKLVDVIGRYYAMDRDNRRERVQKAYNLYVHSEAMKTFDLEKTIQDSYSNGVTDEFMDAIIIENSPHQTIQAGDVVIFANFRSDRAREIVSCLSQKDYPEYSMETIKDLHVLCMTEYDASFKNLEILFPAISLDQTLGQVLSQHGKTQLRIAETEKYPHVSFFFNAGVETAYPGEERILIPSPSVATYDLQPEMSAQAVTDACMTHVGEKSPDFICLNYANPDMVGHTGVFDAVVKACESVDHCLEILVPFLTEQGYTSIILADHGNADYMINEDGSPNTAHSLALVPCWLVNGQPSLRFHNGGSLADIAPTILSLMHIVAPREMTGKNLLY